jgi:hypothetical protein
MHRGRQGLELRLVRFSALLISSISQGGRDCQYVSSGVTTSRSTRARSRSAVWPTAVECRRRFGPSGVQPLQRQRLVRPSAEDRLNDVRRQRRQPQNPADIALRDVLDVADLADRAVDPIVEQLLPLPSTRQGLDQRAVRLGLRSRRDFAAIWPEDAPFSSYAASLKSPICASIARLKAGRAVQRSI